MKVFVTYFHILLCLSFATCVYTQSTQGATNSCTATCTSKNLSDIGKTAQAAAQVPVSLQNIPSPNRGGWNRRCLSFIKNDGSLGRWGLDFIESAKNITIETSENQTHSALTILRQPDLWKKVCPGFEKFSQEQRDHFIVTFIATKAMDEASCDANVYRARGTPNPPAVGFFQLEGQATLRRRRSVMHCGGGYRKGTIQKTLTVKVQLSCAISQIIDTQWKKNRPFCTGRGYWQEANRMSGDICKSMTKYPGCEG